MFNSVGKAIGKWIFDSLNDPSCDNCMNYCKDEDGEMEEECACGCNCGEAGPHDISDDEKQKMIDNWIPPARYCVRAAGQDYWCDDVKPNPLLGWDLFWTQKIAGKDHGVTCTIYDVGVAIVDYETPTTKEVFAHIKQQSFEYAMEQAQAAKTIQEANQGSGSKKLPEDVNFASYG
jgi:hypothetical protein